jgi:hypothetical protein
MNGGLEQLLFLRDGSLCAEEGEKIAVNDAVAAVRKVLVREARQLARLCHRLRATEGHLSVEAGDGLDDEAEQLAGELGCVLADRLQPAVAALLAAAGEVSPAAPEPVALPEVAAEC